MLFSDEGDRILRSVCESQKSGDCRGVKSVVGTRKSELLEKEQKTREDVASEIV